MARGSHYSVIAICQKSQMAFCKNRFKYGGKLFEDGKIKSNCFSLTNFGSRIFTEFLDSSNGLHLF